MSQGSPVGLTALSVGLLAHTATDDLASNAAAIATGLEHAAASGCHLLLTPECTLCGYPSAARANLAGINSCALADYEDQLQLKAERLGVTLICGSAESGPSGWTNDAVIGGACAASRYHKRSLTPIDCQHFVAGSQPSVITSHGWTLGIAICYDLRFAPRFADLAQRNVDAFLVIAHMAGVDPDPGVKPVVIPALCAVRAAEWATPLAFCNTNADDRWCDSGAWDARGLALPLRTNGSLQIATLAPRTTHGPWYDTLRQDHLASLAASSPAKP